MFGNDKGAIQEDCRRIYSSKNSPLLRYTHENTEILQAQAVQ